MMMQQIRYDEQGRRDDEVTRVDSIEQVRQAMIRVGNREVRLHPPGSTFDAWHKGKRFRYRVDEDGSLWQVTPWPERMLRTAAEVAAASKPKEERIAELRREIAELMRDGSSKALLPAPVEGTSDE
jgi:hypothetical protein